MVLTLLSLIFLFNNAEGIAMSWNEAPDKSIHVKRGLSFCLNWFYGLGKNETLLSSEVTLQNGNQNLYIASRHKGDIEYQKYEKAKNVSFSVVGGNNVTLTVHRAEVGLNNTYCLKVAWELADGKRNTDTKCSTTYVYVSQAEKVLSTDRHVKDFCIIIKCSWPGAVANYQWQWIEDLPHIIHHTEAISCKQGDTIKLQCNATGFPVPLVEWIHNDSRPVILERSSYMLLYITGKNTGGRYCCNAKNRFGRTSACTLVNVTEYEPEKTTMLSTRTYKGNINIIHVVCSAAASPPADKFIMRIDDKQFNSSNGKKYYEVQTPRKDVLVSCIPCNKYGQGPLRKIILPVHVPPRFSSPLNTQYNMTIGDIIMKCSATGTPKPNITWTRKETGEIVSTDEYYKMKFIKCDFKRMTFICYASNVMRKISSPEIQVKVMTQENCTSEKESNESTINFSKKLILILGVACGLFVMGIVIVIWKIKSGPGRKEEKQTEESPYQEPIDAITATSDEQLLDHDRSALPDEGYASIQDYILTNNMRSQQDSSFPVTDSRPKPQAVEGREPIYELLVPTTCAPLT